jgi:hypothetical protein
MKVLARVLLLCAPLAALSLTASCVVRPARGAVYVRVAPPVPVVEVETAAPGPEFIWVRGYHRWDGERYLWVPGHWERRPHAGAVWVNGEWKHHRDGWFWVEGHWR